MGIGWTIGVLLRWLSSTESKICHRKMGMGQSIGVLLRLLSSTGSKICHRKMGIGWLIGVLLRWLSSTGSKICHRNMGIGWSIGVLLRWLSSTGSKTCHRKMGMGYSIGVLLRLLSSTERKIHHKNKIINWYKISITFANMFHVNFCDSITQGCSFFWRSPWMLWTIYFKLILIERYVKYKLLIQRERIGEQQSTPSVHFFGLKLELSN